MGLVQRKNWRLAILIQHSTKKDAYSAIPALHFPQTILVTVTRRSSITTNDHVLLPCIRHVSGRHSRANMHTQTRDRTPRMQALTNTHTQAAYLLPPHSQRVVRRTCPRPVEKLIGKAYCTFGGASCYKNEEKFSNNDFPARKRPSRMILSFNIPTNNLGGPMLFQPELLVANVFFQLLLNYSWFRY